MEWDCTAAQLRMMPEFSYDDALAIFGGSVPLYISILQKAIRLMPQNIRRLRGAFEDGAAAAYAIQIHGIKGALNSVGLSGFGAEARALETAAKGGCLDRALHDDFCKTLTAFFLRLADLLPDAAEKNHGNPFDLPERLRPVSEAIEDYDCFRANKLVSEIRALYYGEEWDSLLSNLSDALERFDLDNASRWLKALIQNNSD